MSKILIAYATHHGTTEKIVNLMAQHLPGADLHDVGKGQMPSIEAYDLVVIGGPIQAGKIHKMVKKFCQTNLEQLLQKKLALFICCMYDGQKAEQQFNQAYPDTLRAAAREKAILLGELNLERLNFLEKFVIKNFIGVKQSVSRLQPDEIINFARRLNSLVETS
ncbi:MAG: flavodoxin domain-containing protein [Candidatus Saccharicenans sp.]